MTDELKSKIKTASEKIDKFIDFQKIASKIDSKPVKLLVGLIEMVDGAIFKACIMQVVNVLPEIALPVAEAWLDAFISEDYLNLVDATGEFLAHLDLLKFVDDEKEKMIYVTLLTMLVKLVPQMSNPEV